MTTMTSNRREFLAALVAGATSVSVAPIAFSEPTNLLGEANNRFDQGDYSGAIDIYTHLSDATPDDIGLKYAKACCYARLAKFDTASRELAMVSPQSLDDRRFVAWIRINAGHFDQALAAFDGSSLNETTGDTELLELMSAAAAKKGRRADAWRFFRSLEKQDPASPAIERLIASGQFDFVYDWFGYGPKSLWNYSKGAGSGVVGWTVDTAKGLWRLVRHPIDSVHSLAKAIAESCSRENLRLLLSPTKLAAALGSVVARLYWSAWESCKLSAAREFGLDADSFEQQQAIHEIAAGRMIGYVAPEIVMLVLSFGAGEIASASKAERIVDVAETIGQTERRLERVNQIARSAEFVADAVRLPKLRTISWMSDELWQALKASPKISQRLEQFVEQLSEIRHVPGARQMVQTLAGRLHLDDGYLFQFSRAARYAKEEKLVEIGAKFNVPIALPGKAVRMVAGEADLVLRDGVLVETKLRSGVLSLEEKLHNQLLKYDRAVREGKFKRVLLECSGPVSQQVKNRCSVITSRGTSIEIAERVSW